LHFFCDKISQIALKNSYWWAFYSRKSLINDICIGEVKIFYSAFFCFVEYGDSAGRSGGLHRGHIAAACEQIEGQLTSTP